MRAVDLTGRICGRLTVHGPTGNVAKNKHRLWHCACSCGRRVIVSGSSLTSGNTRSCGCLRMEIVTTHGQARRSGISLAFRRWQNMISRCRNPNNQRFAQYGARGITVCDRWTDFSRFMADMGPCPLGASIDRIDNNGPYAPNNCRWATKTEQAQNQRSNRRLTWNGETHCLSEWARRTGLPRGTLQKRLVSGWDTERILTTPRKA